MKQSIISIIFLFTFLGFQLVSAAETQAKLSYFTEQFPPYNYIDGKQLKGLSVDLLYLVWQRMRLPKQPINVLEWDRAYYLLQQQPNSVLFMTMKTPHRLELFKWACPILTTRLFFIGLSDRDIEIHSFEQAKLYKVAATKAAVGEQLLINQGFDVSNITATSDLEQGLKLLSRRRVDLIVSEMEAVKMAALKLGLNYEQFTPYFMLSEPKGCFAFNQSVPDAFITEFEKHLKDISRSSVYDTLLKRYGLSRNNNTNHTK